MNMTERIMTMETEHLSNIFGQFDSHVKKIEKTLGVTVIVRDNLVKFIGNDNACSNAQLIFKQLYELSKRGNEITDQTVNYELSLILEKQDPSAIVTLDGDIICHTIQGKPVKPKTIGQKKSSMAAIETSYHSTMLFGSTSLTMAS